MASTSSASTSTEAPYTVLCDKCCIEISIPGDMWFANCHNCKGIVLGAPKRGYKYVRCYKKTEGFTLVYDHWTTFRCNCCFQFLVIKDEVAGKVCGQDVYLAEPICRALRRYVVKTAGTLWTKFTVDKEKEEMRKLLKELLEERISSSPSNEALITELEKLQKELDALKNMLTNKKSEKFQETVNKTLEVFEKELKERGEQRKTAEKELRNLRKATVLLMECNLKTMKMNKEGKKEAVKELTEAMKALL